MKTVSLCSLQDYPSLDEFILSLGGISKSSLKKSELKKSFRNQKVVKGKEFSLPLNLLNSKMINPIYSGSDVEILFEDETILALSKPAGIHCHPHLYNDSLNLLSWLRKHGKVEVLNVNLESMDRGLLYRLDAATSGVIILSKSEELYQDVREKKTDIVTEKSYLAVVEGEFKEVGEQRHRIVGSGIKGHKMKEDPQGDLAVSEMQLLSYNSEQNKSLVLVKLHSGLRHQIRIQLALLGYPIVGDSLYQGASFERLLLHAYRYQINWKGKKWLVEDKTFELLNHLFLNLNSHF